MERTREDVVGTISIVDGSVKPPASGPGVRSVSLVSANANRVRLEFKNIGLGNAFLNANDTPTCTGLGLLGMKASTSGHARVPGERLTFVGPAASAAFYAISDSAGPGLAIISVLEFIKT